MEEKILTRHPQGKRGVHISQAKYDAAKASIRKVLRGKALTHVELTEAVEADLTGTFQGSIPWYMECVKLDLEARRVLRRVQEGGMERYRLA